MLALEWVELETLAAQIKRIQAQRADARLKGNIGRLQGLAKELDRAVSARDGLIAHMAICIGEQAA